MPQLAAYGSRIRPVIHSSGGTMRLSNDLPQIEVAAADRTIISSDAKLISVIIPTYNHAVYLGDAIWNILHKTMFIT